MSRHQNLAYISKYTPFIRVGGRGLVNLQNHNLSESFSGLGIAHKKINNIIEEYEPDEMQGGTVRHNYLKIPDDYTNFKKKTIRPPKFKI